MESPLKRPRQPSAKVVANEELASQKATEKETKKNRKPKVSKKAQAEKQRLASRALQEQSVAEVLHSLGASGRPR